MKKFLNRILIYSISTFFILLVIEILLQNTEGTFSNKANYYHNTKKKVEIIILGSSHNQNAINPSLFHNQNIVNLAFGHQDLNLDSKLLEKTVKECPNLKLIIAELSYHSLEFINKPNYWRNSLYLRFYNISPQKKFKLFPWNYSIFLANPTFYLEYYIFNPSEREKFKIDEKGFILNDFYGRFQDYNYNETIIKKNDLEYQKKFNYRDFEALEKNKIIVKKMVQLAKENNISIIFISPPVFHTAYNHYLSSKELVREQFIQELKTEFDNIIFLNYERANDFQIEDFKNDDHLNSKGASKFTSLLINDLSNKNILN